jgi:hypothetical protein
MNRDHAHNRVMDRLADLHVADTSTPKQNVRIHVTQPGQCHVFVNGVEINNVRRVEFDAQARAPITVTLELIPDEVEVTGLCDLAVKHARLIT